MNLELITPRKKVFDGKVKLVQLPGAAGSFEVLENHAPIISTLKQGQVRFITDSGNTEEYNITGGIVETANNVIIVLADKAEKL